jgi:hypothetical protein
MLTRRDMLHVIGAAGVSAATLKAGVASADMPANRTTPNFDVPAGACDCHVHVFDAKFPFADKRIYTPRAPRSTNFCSCSNRCILTASWSCSRVCTPPTMRPRSTPLSAWVSARAAWQ